MKKRINPTPPPIGVRVSDMGTQPNGYEYGDDFLPVGGIRIRPESRRV
jgi:hypothetical protein